MRITADTLRERARKHKSQAETADNPSVRSAHRSIAAHYLQQARAELRDLGPAAEIQPRGSDLRQM
jgi:hypothetical protein